MFGAQATHPGWGWGGVVGQEEGLWLPWKQRENRNISYPPVKHKALWWVAARIIPSNGGRNWSPERVNGFPGYTASEDSERQNGDSNPSLLAAKATSSGSCLVVYKLPLEWEMHSQVSQGTKQKRLLSYQQDWLKIRTQGPGDQHGWREFAEGAPMIRVEGRGPSSRQEANGKERPQVSSSFQPYCGKGRIILSSPLSVLPTTRTY